MLLLIIAIVAGMLTVLAPCILPLLPVVVGGSLADGKVNIRKAITVVTALGFSVIVFTLLLKVSTLFINIPPIAWSLLSGIIIAFIGLTFIFPHLWENGLLAKLSIKANRALGQGDQQKSVAGDILVGVALGPVFTTCSPTYFVVLATVLPVSFLLGLVYLIAYAVGLGVALLLITFIGQKLVEKLDILSNPESIYKKILGVLFIVVGISIVAGFDKQIETKIVNAGFFDATKIEQKLLAYQQSQSKKSDTLPSDLSDETNLAGVNSENSEVASASTVAQENQTGSTNTIRASSNTLSTEQLLKIYTEKSRAGYTRAPEISTPDGFVNTDGKPITLASLRGKVVLLDIWTYSCINCRRTIPYLNTWYDKYKDQGLVIVGLHTPEFAFERVLKNVENAVADLGITYPVVLDNDYSTWNELGNNYWPRKYLIDIDGYIVYDHIGEGGYAETELAIQKALQEKADREKKAFVSQKIQADSTVSIFDRKPNSPETYFGAARNQTLVTGTAGKVGEQTISETSDSQILSNRLYVSGLWNFEKEYAETKGPATIKYKFDANNIYFVASSPTPVSVEVKLDGKTVKTLTIQEDKLYTLLTEVPRGEHLLELVIPGAGLKAFTFTFG